MLENKEKFLFFVTKSKNERLWKTIEEYHQFVQNYKEVSYNSSNKRQESKPQQIVPYARYFEETK